MKPFDTKGEYSPEEVKAALAGVNGTRQLSFRYERLDHTNKYIENIDYVQSCSIENNALADIKRTAKFDILDTGTINYLQDRIKPYVRIAMPQDITYSEYVETLDPVAWWKMDDATVTPAPSVKVTRSSGVTYNTAATADFVDLSIENARAAGVQLGSGTMRSEYWSYVNTLPSRALQIQLHNTGTASVLWETYSAPALDGEMTLVRSRTMGPGDDITYAYPFPAEGVFLVRMVALTTTNTAATITYYKSVRLEDSSGNGEYAVGADLTLGASGVVSDGGTSMVTLNSDSSFMTNDPNIYLNGGVTLNYWINRESYGNKIVSEYGTQTGILHFEINDDGTPNVFRALMVFTSYNTSLYPNLSSTINIPTNVFTPGPKMVTFAVDTAARGARLFINGNIIGTFAQDMSAYAELFNTEHINYTYQYSYSTTRTTFDDFSMYSKGLPSSSISELYQRGSHLTPKRSGYVEWPQGVFVLSSPSRALSEGGSISRDVEGYDQLVVLKEDSFDYRYSVAAGTKYTEAVKKVVQSCSPTRKITLVDDGWSFYGANVSHTADSVLLPTSDTNQVYLRSNLYYQLGEFSMSAKVTTPSTGGMATYFFLEILDGDTLTKVMMGRSGSNFISWVYNDKTNTSIGSPYNATTMAYWRIREDAGYIKMEYSLDRVTWALHRTIKNTFSASAKLRVIFYADHDAAVTGSAMTGIDVSAAIAVNSSVTDSSTVLVTPMEWEPGTSKLSIINDLLGAINYGSATYDEDGIFIARPYISPYDRASGFTYATDSSSVITNGVDQTVDMFGIPNKWVLVVSDPERPWMSGSYTNTNPLSPTSTVSRGRTIVDYRTEQNAPDSTTLAYKAARLAYEASQVYEVIEFNTAIMPIHQNADVYNLIIDDLAVDSKYSETEWSMDLENGGTMKHKIRKIVGV